MGMFGDKSVLDMTDAEFNEWKAAIERQREYERRLSIIQTPLVYERAWESAAFHGMGAVKDGKLITAAEMWESPEQHDAREVLAKILSIRIDNEAPYLIAKAIIKDLHDMDLEIAGIKPPLVHVTPEGNASLIPRDHYGAVAALQSERDALMHQLMALKAEREPKHMASWLALKAELASEKAKRKEDVRMFGEMLAEMTRAKTMCADRRAAIAAPGAGEG